MLGYIKKIAVAASLLALYAGQFDAWASSNNNNELVEIVNEAASATLRVTQHAAGKLDSDQSASNRVLHKEFFPRLPNEVKVRITHYALLESSPLLLSQVCRSWCGFILEYDLDVEMKLDIAAMTKTVLSDPQSILCKWLARKGSLRLKAGIFQFQPEGAQAIDVNLSTMYADYADGELVLPDTMAPFLCITRRITTFSSPERINKGKTLLLLLTPSELQGVAGDIITEASFRHNITKAPQNSACALLRYGGDDLALGFTYTILMFREMRYLSLWQLATHEKTCRVGRRVPGSSGRGLSGDLAKQCFFVFEPELNL
jgi:hypothetical protein